MSNQPKFTMTNESISIFSGGKMHTVQKGTGNFVALRNAIINEDWDAVPKNLTVAKALVEWVKGKFTLDGDTVSFEGNVLPRDLSKRITEMAANGESPEPLTKFWEKLQKNPSFRSVNQLWPFLNQKGIPFTKSGNFLAYKSVRMDYRDHHSGEFDNSPGRVNEMPRNKISDDPELACHDGFHVGALEYARSFGSGGRRIVICEIDPADVVCIPHDSSQQKMRVCKYKVIGNHNGQYMSDTVHEEDPADVNEGLDAGDMDPPDADGEVDDGQSPPDYVGGSEEDPPGYDLEKDPLLSDEERVEERKKKASAPPKSLKDGKGKGPLPQKPNAKLDPLKLDGLMEQSIDVLRKYAGKNLLITGASKIPGGKTALVAAILKIRK